MTKKNPDSNRITLTREVRQQKEQLIYELIKQNKNIEDAFESLYALKKALPPIPGKFLKFDDMEIGKIIDGRYDYMVECNNDEYYSESIENSDEEVECN